MIDGDGAEVSILNREGRKVVPSGPHPVFAPSTPSLHDVSMTICFNG